MGGGLDIRHVEFLKFLDVAEDVAELLAKPFLLFRHQPEPGQVSHVFDINLDGGHGSFLVEFPFHQLLDRGDRLSGVRSVGLHDDFAAGAGREHHQAHDALAVDGLAVLLHEDIAGETVGGFHEHRRGPGMNAELVGDQKFLLHQRAFVVRLFGAH